MTITDTHLGIFSAKDRVFFPLPTSQSPKTLASFPPEVFDMIFSLLDDLSLCAAISSTKLFYVHGISQLNRRCKKWTQYWIDLSLEHRLQAIGPQCFFLPLKLSIEKMESLAPFTSRTFCLAVDWMLDEFYQEHSEHIARQLCQNYMKISPLSPLSKSYFPITHQRITSIFTHAINLHMHLYVKKLPSAHQNASLSLPIHLCKNFMNLQKTSEALICYANFLLEKKFTHQALCLYKSIPISHIRDALLFEKAIHFFFNQQHQWSATFFRELRGRQGNHHILSILCQKFALRGNLTLARVYLKQTDEIGCRDQLIVESIYFLLAKNKIEHAMTLTGDVTDYVIRENMVYKIFQKKLESPTLYHFSRLEIATLQKLPWKTHQKYLQNILLSYLTRQPRPYRALIELLQTIWEERRVEFFTNLPTFFAQQFADRLAFDTLWRIPCKELFDKAQENLATHYLTKQRPELAKQTLHIRYGPLSANATQLLRQTYQHSFWNSLTFLVEHLQLFTKEALRIECEDPIWNLDLHNTHLHELLIGLYDPPNYKNPHKI